MRSTKILGCGALVVESFAGLLTFLLSCWLAASVCCGVLLAITAGVAYGYNYCLAEFISLKSAEVKVLVRRGQLPDIPYQRRFDAGDDSFPFNVSDNQPEVGLDRDSSYEKWLRDQDVRNYDARLREKPFVERRPQDDITQSTVYYKFTTPPFRRVSYLPNRIISTTILQSGNSEIVLRQFDIMPDNISDLVVNDTKSYDYQQKNLRDDITSEEESQMKDRPLAPDIRIRVEDHPLRTLEMRHWRTTAKAVTVDSPTDLDEEAIVYKAI